MKSIPAPTRCLNDRPRNVGDRGSHLNRLFYTERTRMTFGLRVFYYN
nr:MAG TPA: hypothetical protein [Caudoviricetes sp.]